MMHNEVNAEIGFVIVNETNQINISENSSKISAVITMAMEIAFWVERNSLSLLRRQGTYPYPLSDRLI